MHQKFMIEEDLRRMANIICYEVFPKDNNIRKMRRVLVWRHGFREKQNQYGEYFYLETSSLDSWLVEKVLKRHNYKYRSFDKRYSRNTQYRKTFFDTHKGPYHCVYCGKRLRDDYIEVDHLIPVAKAKSSLGVRTWLHVFGITNINDPKNLVASCQKCNRKKSDKMGLWVLRGMIGRFKIVWAIRNIVIALCIALLLYVLYNNFPVFDWLAMIIDKIKI